MSRATPTEAGSQPGVTRVFQTKDQTRAFYNRIGRVYDFLADGSGEPVRHAGLQKLNAQPGENVLEIGFGTGRCLCALARAVGPAGKAYGIELSDVMLQVTQEMLQSAGLADHAELRQGDAVTLPYPTGSLDAIFMSFTLESVDTPEIPRLLAECRRGLRVGGRIVVVGMSKETEDGTMLKAFEWVHHHFPNFLYCRPIFVRNAVEDAGFQIESVERTMMSIPVEIVLALNGEPPIVDAAPDQG